MRIIIIVIIIIIIKKNIIIIIIIIINKNVYLCHIYWFTSVELPGYTQ